MDRDAPSRAFEAAYSVLVLVFLVGIHLDSRTHVHDTPETFLTVEHGIFYAAAAGLGLLLAYAWTQRTHRRDRLPPGYGLAAVGVVLFGVAGVSDLLWHEAFGIEADIEALVSPTHLLLAAGAFLFATAPTRSAWAGGTREGWVDRLPAAVGVLGGLGVLSFMVQFLHPVSQAVAAHDYQGGVGLAGGLAGWIVAPALLAGAAIALDQGPGPPPIGHLTLVFLADGLLLGIPYERWPLVLSMVAAGLAGEATLRAPGLASPWRERLAGAAVGLATGLAYLGILASTVGIAWNAHLAGGAVALATAAGALAGLAVTLGDASSPSPGSW